MELFDNYAKRHVECLGVPLMNLEVAYYTYLLRGLEPKGWHGTLRLRGQGMMQKLSSTINISEECPKPIHSEVMRSRSDATAFFTINATG